MAQPSPSIYIWAAPVGTTRDVIVFLPTGLKLSQTSKVVRPWRLDLASANATLALARSNSFAGQLARLLDPSGELSFVKPGK
jgi:hypothetical protein